MIKTEIVAAFLLGLGFLLLLTSFITILNVQEFIFRSVQIEDPTFYVSGYFTWASQFAASAATCLFSPSIVNKVGPRVTLVIGGIIQLSFNLQFLLMNQYLIYFSCVTRGIAMSLIWTAQGRYLTQNSQQDTIIRNSGIFLLTIHANRILGNTYTLLRFSDEHFDYAQRMEFYGVMSAITLLACVIFVTLPLALYNKPVHIKFRESLVSTLHHSQSKKSMSLLALYMYCGMQFSFASGIYSNCIGFTLALPNIPMRRMALSGLGIGFGGIVGGIIFGIIGKKIKTRSTVMIIGFFIQLINVILVSLNLPNSSPTMKTSDKAILTSNIHLALLSSFVFGIMDSLTFAMAYGLFAVVFKDKIVEAHATYRICSYSASATQFLYAPYLGLYGILSIIIVLSLIATISYLWVERKHILTQRAQENVDSVDLESRNKETKN